MKISKTSDTRRWLLWRRVDCHKQLRCPRDI